jgi:hypothetical protein
MKTDTLLVFILGWAAANMAQVVLLLQALLPVLAICALAYAIYALSRDKAGKK